jgi:hypothetical protein
MIYTFLSHKKPRTDTFLRDLGLAKLRSTAQVLALVKKPSIHTFVSTQITINSKRKKTFLLSQKYSVQYRKYLYPRSLDRPLPFRLIYDLGGHHLPRLI